jgi:exonuclease V gamma subunit
VLAEALREALFFRGSQNLFAQRTIATTHPRMKEFLFRHWALDPEMGIAAGVEMISLSELLQRLEPGKPSKRELAFRIEPILSEIPELEEYFQGSTCRRHVLFADQMGELFFQYGVHGGKELDAWLQISGWQQRLWKRVHDAVKSEPLSFSPCLFHVGFLPRRQLELLDGCGAHLFLLSPTDQFWGDFATPYEREKILSRSAERGQEELLGYFGAENRFLSALGKRGRKLALFLEEIPQATEERYVPISAAGSLADLQRGMLELTQETLKTDHHVQIHSATSRLREVEIVWELVHGLGAPPKEIAIFAPDIGPYRPFIDLVFGSRETRMSVAVLGVKAEEESPALQGLKGMIEFARSDYPKADLFRLLHSAPFYRKMGLADGDLKTVEAWISDAAIFGGSGDRSWEAGFQRIILSLALPRDEAGLDLDLGEMDLLETWITGMKRLLEALRPWQEGRQSVATWSRLMGRLLREFFELTPLEERALDKLASFERLNIPGEFPWESMERILNDLLNAETDSGEVHALEALKFSSLREGAIFPARWVIVMGLEEGQFPRSAAKSSLEEVQGEYLPSPADNDRALFLELLLSAREGWIGTYSRVDEDDGREQSPSPLLEELFPDVPIVHHPEDRVDPWYFQPESPVRSHSHDVFTALSRAGAIEQRLSFIQPPVVSQDRRKTMGLHLLRKLARAPHRLFLEERLGVVVERQAPCDPRFFLSPLDLYQVERMTAEEAETKLVQSGKLPHGPFRAIALRQLHEHLTEIQVEREGAFAVELSPRVDRVLQMSEREWAAPAVVIGSTTITGRIERLSPRGMILRGKASAKTLLKAWPEILLFLSLDLPCEKKVIFTEGDVWELNGDALAFLGKYLDYFSAAEHGLSLLFPTFGEVILHKNGEGLGELIAKEEEPALTWIQSTGPLTSIQGWSEVWIPFLREVFDGQI